jgi:putative oxidoreductase
MQETHHRNPLSALPPRAHRAVFSFYMNATITSSTTSHAASANPLSAAWLLVKTPDSAALLIARLTLGLVFFPHGAQKVLGWFGGYGFTGTMGYFTGMMHIPAPLAFLAIAAEFAGSLGLITGLLSRVAAFGIAANMIVAIVMVHGANGFFMNWYGNQKGEGIEYHLLVLGLALIVILYGGGKASVDRFITARRSE